VIFPKSQARSNQLFSKPSLKIFQSERLEDIPAQRFLMAKQILAYLIAGHSTLPYRQAAQPAVTGLIRQRSWQ